LLNKIKSILCKIFEILELMVSLNFTFDKKKKKNIIYKIFENLELMVSLNFSFDKKKKKKSHTN